MVNYTLKQLCAVNDRLIRIGLLKPVLNKLLSYIQPQDLEDATGEPKTQSRSKMQADTSGQPLWYTDLDTE